MFKKWSAAAIAVAASFVLVVLSAVVLVLWFFLTIPERNAEDGKQYVNAPAEVSQFGLLDEVFITDAEVQKLKNSDIGMVEVIKKGSKHKYKCYVAPFRQIPPDSQVELTCVVYEGFCCRNYDLFVQYPTAPTAPKASP